MIFRVFSRFLPLFLLLLLTHVGAAQPLPDRFPLSGFAADSAGKPLSGAIITLRRQEDNGSYAFWGGETATDARGAFRFERAETGRYYLTAEAAGFAPIYNQVVIWKSGDSAIRLRFERLVTLHLQIFAPQTSTTAPVSAAQPLANAQVWVRLRGDGSAGQSTRRVLTSGDGKVNLEGLLPAQYSLYVATPRGYAIEGAVALHQETSLRTYLREGGALSVSVSQKGVPTRFLGGAMLTLTAIDAAESTRLMGNLADSGENFALLALGSDMSALTSRDGDGKIDISHLPPGNYLARLRLPFYTTGESQPITIREHQSSSATFEATVSPDEPAPEMASLTLNLREKDAPFPGGFGAVGGVEQTRKTHAARGEFSLRLLPINAQGALSSDESPDSVAFSPGGTPARRALADANGQITLFPIKVGRYRVFVSPHVPASNSDNPNGGSPEAASIDIDVPSSGATGTLILLDEVDGTSVSNAQ